MTARLAGCAVALAVGLSAVGAEATQIDFTGGTVYLNGGVPTSPTNNIDKYEENGFLLDFIQVSGTSGAVPFATHIGDYYNVGNDVIHSHWQGGGDGDVTAVEITKVGGGTFDLNYFILTSNTAGHGDSGSPSFLEEAYIEGFNSMVSTGLMQLPSEDWGFPATQIYLSSAFDSVDLVRIYVTNAGTPTNDGNPLNDVNCFGMDEFYIDEQAPPQVPEPSTLLLSGSALAALVAYRRRRKS